MEDDSRREAGMDEIAVEVRGCTRCPLAATRTNAVPGHGNTASVVLFVGEGPGAEEDRQGKPFVGRSGQFLTNSLARLGIRREDVFITNIVKCRPPENRDPQPNEIGACSDYLTRQIALINPRIIVTLGRMSMGRWLPGASITKVHGQIKNVGHGRVVLPMFHPAAALRNPQWAQEFDKDMAQLPRLIERALRANEAAARREALPAGVPHPGDVDYVAPRTEPPAQPAPEAKPANDAGASGDASDSGLTQLSLF